MEEAIEKEKNRSEDKKKNVKKNKKDKKKKGNNPFGNMNMGGMPFMFDMGQMFANMSPDEHQMMMDDFEKMMGGFGFPGGGFPGGGFPGGFPGFGGK